jgi:hypothetical protein
MSTRPQSLCVGCPVRVPALASHRQGRCLVPALASQCLENRHVMYEPLGAAQDAW